MDVDRLFFLESINVTRNVEVVVVLSHFLQCGKMTVFFYLLALTIGVNNLLDIVFLDPPYGTGLLQQALEKVSSKVKKTGIILAENSENEEILQNYGEFMLDRQKHYGKIKVSMFRHRDFI